MSIFSRREDFKWKKINGEVFPQEHMHLPNIIIQFKEYHYITDIFSNTVNKIFFKFIEMSFEY